MNTRKINLNFSENLFTALQMCKGGETITEFIENAVMERCEEITRKKRGDKTLVISNPQLKAPTAAQELDAMKIRETFLKLAPAETFGTDFKLDELTKFIIERVVTDTALQRENFVFEKNAGELVFDLCKEYRREKYGE